MFKAYKNFWKNYVNFNGRSTRSDYWWFVLGNTIIWVIWSIITVGFGARLVISYFNNDGKLVAGDSLLIGFVVFLLLVGLVYAIATFIPRLSLLYRRFADTGLNPWWYSLVVISELSSFGSFLTVRNAIVNIVLFLIWIAIFVITVSKTDAYAKK